MRGVTIATISEEIQVQIESVHRKLELASFREPEPGKGSGRGQGGGE